jgi:hypothetical protein
VTFLPRREARWEYAAETVDAIERWNCSIGHGCVHGAAPGSPEWTDLGPGGTCSLLAQVFLQEEIQEMDDDSRRVTCNAYEQRPDPSIPEGQLTIGEGP